MNAMPPPQNNMRDHQLSSSDFDAIAVIALREFGLSLPKSKCQLVQSRLARRVRSLKLPGFGEYRRLLDGPEGLGERTQLLSALTTNVTKFFREIHHFDLMSNVVMPDLVARARNGERIRLWSAGCSSGQEPYSIAMTALKCDPEIGQYDFKILATDIDPAIIIRAREAVYQDQEMEGVSETHFRKSDIHRDINKNPGLFSPSKEVRSLITFGVLNLIEDLPFSGRFDVIFCRNVAIYFDAQTQELVWNRFAGLLPPQGCLFIGHSERIKISDHPDLIPDGVTVYRKK